MGYHLREITKGKLGESSKIKEELEEFDDAIEQNNRIMALCELSDIYGALKALAATMGTNMEEIRSMSEATERAFASGRRK